MGSNPSYSIASLYKIKQTICHGGDRRIYLERVNEIFGLLPVLLKFTFTENGWGALSPKLAPCAN